MGFFKFGKKKVSDPAPTQEDRDETWKKRYEGRPLLVILDKYIIDCLGFLAQDEQRRVAWLVRKAFGDGQDWKQTVRNKLKLHDSLDDTIRQAWAQSQTQNPGVDAIGFAVAFSDRYFAPMIEHTFSERGDRAADPDQQREAQERKNRSLAILRTHNVPTIAHLPAIETAATAAMRTPEEVARRVTVLSLVAAFAEPGSFPREELLELLKQRGVKNDLTPKEREFIALSNPTERQRSQFIWCYEGVKVLLWALGLVNELDYPAKHCDVPGLVRVIAQSDPLRFLSEAKLRDTSVILDEADLIYRYDWACVNARVKGAPAPGGLDAGIVMERHLALNWLIGYQGQEWDDVSADT